MRCCVASHLLGGLAERELLRSVPQAVLRRSEWTGVFELLRLREAAWGSRIMAVPFGSPLLVCYYRADLLEKLGKRPPQTWHEYRRWLQLLAAEKPGDGGPWCGTIEPLAPGWAGLVLLARAAPYAKHRDNYSTLFNVETMEPLVAGPPVCSGAGGIGRARQVRPDRSSALRSERRACRILAQPMWHGPDLAQPPPT